MESPPPPADIQVREATASGSSHLHIGNNVNNNYAAPQAPAPVPALSTVPFLQDQNFVRRSSLLDDLHNILSAPAGRAALCGLGGVGKSQLAIEYSFQVRSRRPDTWVFWVYASSAQGLQASVRDNLKQLEIPGVDEPGVDTFQAFQRWLRDVRNGRWLLILDNVDDTGILDGTKVAGDVETTLGLQSWSGSQLLENLATCRHGTILVTTRSRAAALKVVEFEKSIIDVRQMDESESILLLKVKLDPKFTDAEATILASALDHMPLAMAQAAAYIKGRRGKYTVQQYLATLDKSEKSMLKELERDWVDPRRHKEARNSIALTWQISFEQIRKDRPSAADLLSLMSFFDRQTIPEALLKDKILPFDDDTLGTGTAPLEQSDEAPNVIEATGEASSADSDHSDSDSSSSDGADAAEEAFDKDVGTLIDYSFVSETTDGEVYEMHRLVQKSTQGWLTRNKAFERWASQFVSNLCNAFPLGKFENWTVCRPLFPHAIRASEMKLSSRGARVKQSYLLCNAGRFAHGQGSFALAVTFYKIGSVLDQELYGEVHVNTLVSMGNLAWIYSNQGRWKEAEELQVKVLEAQRGVLGEEHVDTLSSMNNLASTYWGQGRWQEAEELQLKEVEARQRVQGEEHGDTLTSMNNLAVTYRDQGRWKVAEELHIKVLEAQRGVLGEEHVDTLSSMNNLASTYLNQGRWKEAEELQVKVLEARRSSLGEEHILTIKSMNNLAATYSTQGRHKEAEGLQVKVLEARRRVFGEEHIYTFTSMGNLASTYPKQGRWKEAEVLQVKVLETRRRVLGVEHPYTLTSMANLAVTLRGLEQHDAAVNMMKQAASLYAKVLGVEHPETIQRFKWLDYWADEDLNRKGLGDLGLAHVSNGEQDAVAGTTDGDEEDTEGSGYSDNTSSEQHDAPRVCLLNPETIALLRAMGITRISGLPDPAAEAPQNDI